MVELSNGCCRGACLKHLSKQNFRRCRKLQLVSTTGLDISQDIPSFQINSVIGCPSSSAKMPFRPQPGTFLGCVNLPDLPKKASRVNPIDYCIDIVL